MSDWIAAGHVPLKLALLAAFPAGTLLAIGGYLLVFARRFGPRTGLALLVAGLGLWLGNAFYLLLALFPAS